MLSKEIKELINISGGKIVISEGNINDSYVVIKLDKYLQGKNIVTNRRYEERKDNNHKTQNELTGNLFLDNMDADIETIREMRKEKEIRENFILKDNNNNKEKIEYDYSE